MRILKVIHGFPPDYMAGSEIYSYHLVKELINHNVETFVFTRVENEFHQEYRIYNEVFENIPIQRVNKPRRDYLFRDKFFDEKLDEIFKEYVLKIKPDIVHFGHLSHLSTNLIKVVKKLNIPVVYTIHDFWLFCVKGQMINSQGVICTNPSIENCTHCSPYVIDKTEIKKIFIHMKEIINMIDVFISPSCTLRNFFISQGVAKNKIHFLKYGFDKDKIKYCKKIFRTDSKINFGFMGRIIPTKGIKLLVDVFNELPNEKLSIYGNVGVQKRFLETENIIFKGGYNNNNINDVLNEIDVLIVPSIWYENAPLVIQEAFLAGIPVITSDIGGMAELVRNEENGFTFKTGCSKSLKKVIIKITSNPEILNNLVIDRNSVVDIRDDAKAIIKIYNGLKNGN